jgi:hypothetical protein
VSEQGTGVSARLEARLDGEVLAVDDARTWGELLSLVDAQLAAQDLIVTDVAFDGLDEPAFRENAVLARTLDGLASVEVQSGTPASLMERCMAEAIAATDALATAALRVAADFRARALLQARGGLVELAEGLGSLMAITGAAGIALHVDLERAVCGGRSIAAVVREMTGYVDAIVGAQQAGSWLAIAQVLERDVEPALRRWKLMLDVFRPAA